MTDHPLELPTLHGERVHLRAWRDSDVATVQEASHDPRAVGLIGLFFSAGAGARASIGYWIIDSQRRRGYAAEALDVLTTWALHHVDVDRLELYVEPWNTGSWRAAEHAGYAREGLLRAWERIDGTPRDMYMYSRLTLRE